MDPFTLGFVCAVLVAALSLGVCWRLAAIDAGWRAAAKALGLTFEPRGLFRAPRLRGRIGDLSVLVDTANTRRSDHLEEVTRVRVSAPALPPGFEVGPKSVWSRVAQRLWTHSGRLSDGRFDRDVKVEGDPSFTLAVLSPEVREKLHRLTSLQGQIQKGALMLPLRGHDRGPEPLVRHVDFLTALARDLSMPEAALPEALRARAVEDPSSEVRRRSLQALVRHYGDSLEAKRAVKDRLADFDPQIRLIAAEHAQAEGVTVASDVFYDPDAAPHLRGRALQVWSSLVPARDPALRRALAVALASPSEPVLQTGALLVASRKERGLRGHVLAALSSGPPSAQAAALAALGAVGDQRDFDVVARGLTARDPEVRVAAAIALGRFGGREAVERLLPLTRGLGQPARVKDAARGAVAAIQARMGGDRGGLALVDETNAGHLSPVPKGRLSVSDEGSQSGR